MIRVPGFEGRRVAVFGLGRSGLTAARALKAGGAEPVLWDDGISSRMQAEAEGFIVEDLTAVDWSGFAALVLSPGVPLTHPVPHWTVDKATEAGVEIVGDLELFARALAALPEGQRPQVVAITGTNGKSTTTALIAWVLKQAGMTVHMGGNIGIGVLALPEPTPGAVYVIECSSYQLDLTTSFAPDVAILTNISPDHLDRHGGMEGYVAAKARIFRADTTNKYIGVDDPSGVALLEQLRRRGSVDEVSVDRPLEGVTGMYLHEGWLTYNVRPRPDGPVERCQIVDLSKARSLPGRHNAQNAAFAFLAATDLGLPHEVVIEGLLSFPGLAHRMEPVGRAGRVRFINDSKATNADAARQALAAYDRVFWIAGGRAKAGGIDDLAELFPRVVEAFLIGEAAGPFAAALGDVPHRISGDMATAVQQAFEAASASGREEVVLLSPAAASFDQFPDFEARGEAFRAAALALGAKPEPAP
ncbi:UDP-N-acetylmuramoyl-L-alanine--D-glutamate ligase [Brevundimonas sp.]|uniref:UDP-N-acetylmuramoyl-L-alanine--D-glutamate ligase n=1 Tax=Brevundimonas sp. TaxID=1871086 RepID=UPI001D9E9987|nr:UDP-N-acetylmuramoyl-L-alanine--D-glutamate ligase [Brevundimonas sp.]MBL0946891.1 UDP-N-acetylmuramoyl-L-alanine--D-glutamate ligase [Brevundimonas sp.]